jgi:hypothetical protein
MAQPALPCIIKTLAIGGEVADNFQPIIRPAGFFHGTNPISAAAGSASAGGMVLGK